MSKSKSYICEDVMDKEVIGEDKRNDEANDDWKKYGRR